VSVLCRLWIAVLAASLAGCGGGAYDFYWASRNVDTTDNQAGNSTAPALATLSNGDLAVAWQFLSTDGKVSAVRLQRFDANGARIGSEKTINRSSLARAGRPGIAPLNDGGYVVAWITPDYAGLYAQRFDAADNRVGDERRVSSLALDASSEFGVSALNDGGYLFAWVASDGSVYSRRFHDVGDPEAETRLDPLESTARSAFVAGLGDGGWVITWTHLRPYGGGIADVYAQRFDADGGKRDRQFTVNATAAALQSVAGIAGLRSGRYVVVWAVQAAQVSSSPGAGVYAQCFDAAGGRVQPQTLVKAATDRQQARPVVGALKDGGYLVAWESLPASGSDWDVYAQRFDAGARGSGGAMLVKPNGSAGNQQQVAVAGADDGGYTLAWTSTIQGSTSTIDMARYDANNRLR